MANQHEVTKASLLEQVEGLIRKGVISGVESRTLIAKIELADPRLLKMFVDRMANLRKAEAEEEALAKSAPKK
jgi:hypothetical protein